MTRLYTEPGWKICRLYTKGFFAGPVASGRIPLMHRPSACLRSRKRIRMHLQFWNATRLTVGPCGLIGNPDQNARPTKPGCNFAYSALASFRMGMSGSASFQRAKKSWYAERPWRCRRTGRRRGRGPDGPGHPEESWSSGRGGRAIFWNSAAACSPGPPQVCLPAHIDRVHSRHWKDGVSSKFAAGCFSRYCTARAGCRDRSQSRPG